MAQRRESRWTVSEDEAGLSLGKFLAAPARLGSRGRAAGAVERGKIFVNGVEARAADVARRLAPGEEVRLWMDRPGSAKRHAPAPADSGPLRIVYEDAALIVLDKPAHLLAVPLERRPDAGSAYDFVEERFRSKGKRRPLVVHRIDRDTSGLVVFAKTVAAQQRLKEQFKRREPERVYLAIVYGHPDPSAGTWRDRLVWDTTALVQKQTHAGDPKGKEAISEYRVLERFQEASLIEVRLRTGKRNQIRIQARLRGHTLVGERRYVYGPDALRPIDFPRQALHASRLGFRHPENGRPLRFEAPLPPDMAALIERLRTRGRRISTGTNGPAGDR
jgi:23S rRNA pseudouridine1911/1915/1917 synthase